MSVDVGSAVGYLDLDISGFLEGLKTAQSEADKQSKNIATTMGNNISSMGKGLSSAGKTLTKNFTVPLLGIGAAGLKVATDFEKGMSEVKAISGATGKDFDALRDKAVDLGATTAFSAGEVASAMTEMAKAGWSSQQIIDGMGGVLDAAAASGEGLATVSTIVADAITGFGLEAKESTKVADLLTQAANSGTIGITDLGESFKYIAPVAGSMGMSIEDVTTAIAAMSMAGIKGSSAGTALRTMLTNLVKPSDTMADAMIDLGLATVDAEGNFVSFVSNADGSMKSLDELIDMMRDGMAGMTEEQKAATAAALAGKEGMSGLLAILNLTEEEYDALAATMDNANGVAQETAEIMQDNLQSKVEQLGGALESLAIKLADYLIPYIQQFVVWLTNLVDKFTSLDEGTQKMILKFAGLVVVAGPVLSVFGKLVTVIGSTFTAIGKLTAGFTAAKTGGTVAAGVLSKLGAVIGGISAPIALVVAGIGVLIAAFVSLWKNNEEFRNKVTAIWNQVKEAFSSFFDGIVKILNSLGFEFKNFSEVLSALWKGLCDLLGPLFIGAFQFIVDTLDGILNMILAIVKVFIGLFTGNWEIMLEGIKQAFETTFNYLVDFLKNIGTVLAGVLDAVLGWFGTSWANAWESIKTSFVNVWEGITSWFETTMDNFANGFKKSLDEISAFFTDIWNGIQTFFVNLWDGISSWFQTTINNLSTGFKNNLNDISAFFTSTWENIKAYFANAMEGIKSIVSDGFTSASNTISNIFDGIRNKISEVMEGAKNIVSNAIERIKSFFNFSWSLPKLKLPHISISGKFSLSPPSVPKFGIDWYNKAMDNGIILNGATIFGMDKFGNLMGGGETGSETVVGTNSLMKMIRNAVKGSIEPIIDVMYEVVKATAELGYVTYNGFTNAKQVYENNKDGGNTRNGGQGGDTFIFNSPKAIDEVEAARQMRKAKRELAEGF